MALVERTLFQSNAGDWIRTKSKVSAQDNP